MLFSLLSLYMVEEKQLHSSICTLYIHLGHASLSLMLPCKHLSRGEEIPNHLVDCIFKLQGNPLIHLDHLQVHLWLTYEMGSLVTC